MRTLAVVAFGVQVLLLAQCFAEAPPASRSSVLLKVESPEELRYAGEPSGVAISPDGRTVAAGWLGAVASCWDVDTGKKVHQMRLWSVGNGYCERASGSGAIAFSPDGGQLLTGKAIISAPSTRPTDVYGDCVAQARGALVWNVTTGKPLRALLETEGPSLARWSPTGRTIVTSNTSGITSWDLSTGGVVWHRDVQWTITGLDISLDGTQVVFSNGTAITTLRANDGAEVSTLAGDLEFVRFVGDGKHLVAQDYGLDGQRAGVLTVRDTAGRVVWADPRKDRDFGDVRGFAPVPGTHSLVIFRQTYIPASRPGEVGPIRGYVYDWDAEKEVCELGVWQDSLFNGVSVSKDGRRAAMLIGHELRVVGLP